MSGELAAPSRGRIELRRILIGALVVVIIGAAGTLFGWDISGWFQHIWDTIKAIPLGDLLLALVLITLQTAAAAYAWYWILRYGYPESRVRWLDVLAIYAAAVGLNWVVPANLGTLAMLLMFN